MLLRVTELERNDSETLRDAATCPFVWQICSAEVHRNMPDTTGSLVGSDADIGGVEFVRTVGAESNQGTKEGTEAGNT